MTSDGVGRVFARRALLGLLAASSAAAFLGTFDALEDLLPNDVPLVGPKRAHFLEHRDTYTFLAIGTSTVFRHFIPPLFDEVMTAQGFPQKSFNFGVSRFAFVEAEVLAAEVAASRPRSLRWVLLEVGMFASLGKRNEASARDIDWHTPEQTARAVGEIFDERKGRDKFARAKKHIDAMLRRETPAGRGAHSFRTRWDKKAIQSDEMYPRVENEGYQPLEELLHVRRIRGRNEKFLAERAAFEARIEGRKLREVPSRGLSREKVQRFQRIADRLVDAGYSLAFMDSPAFRAPRRLPPGLRGLGPMFQYNDPKRYPELYLADHRFDASHLNKAGAEVFTRRFAEDFAAHLRSASR